MQHTARQAALLQAQPLAVFLPITGVRHRNSGDFLSPKQIGEMSHYVSLVTVAEWNKKCM